MRSLKISDSLATVLVACRAQEGREGPPTIALARIAAAERSLERELPDDLVAAWASVDRAAVGGHVVETFVPEGAVAATAEVHNLDYVTDGLADDFVALFNTGTRGEYVCLASSVGKKGKKLAAGSHVVTMQFSDEEPPVETDAPVSLEEWLIQECGVTAKDLAAARRRTKGFAVVLEVAPASQVRHPKFGAGEIVEEVGDRIVVRFVDGQTRKILRSAVVA